MRVRPCPRGRSTPPGARSRARGMRASSRLSRARCSAGLRSFRSRPTGSRSRAILSSSLPLRCAKPRLPAESRFLQACRRERTGVTPVWFMRQAGRYLPEYRALRRDHSILELCHNPELATQVTLQPVDRLGVDAAIVFADILLPFEPLGLGLSFAAGEGPQISHPIRDGAQVARLPAVDPETALGYVLETVRLVARALPSPVPVIGFAGAPFTLASYAIEGGASRTFQATKQFMYTEPAAWHALMGHLAELVGRFLAAQVRA